MKRSILLVALLMLGCFSGCKGVSDPADKTLTVNPDGLALEENGIVYESLAQKAVIKTALAYLARGTRIQYADTRLNVNSAPSNAGTLYRWQAGVRKSPEEYTTQYLGYSNCAAFTHDVYLAALDMSIGAYTTSMMTQLGGKQRVYKYFPTGEETAEQMAAVEAEFRSHLKIGDIIVVRYNGSKTGNGHAMLYVGEKVLQGVEGYRGAAAEKTDENGVPADNGYVYDIIHSTGSNYDYTNQVEKYEMHGTVQITSVDSLFDDKNHRYVFDKLDSIAIIRPLENFTKDVPEDTQNRMLYMENIVAEKLSSHTGGMTVNPGDTMSFTFSITNKNGKDVTLAVKDKVPENTTYVSGAETAEGGALGWTVTVPAGKTEEVSYTVRVNENAVPGQYIAGTEGSVGGVPVNCPKVYVGRTLSKEEREALLTAARNLSDTPLRGMELANALYREVPGMGDLLTDDINAVLNEVFTPSGMYYYLSGEDGYGNMVAPGLFGGRYVPQRDLTMADADSLARQENNRTRLPYADQLMVGDILIAVENAETEAKKLYLYTGEKMLDLLSGGTLTYADSAACLEKVIAYNRFAILRPSLMLDSKN